MWGEVGAGDISKRPSANEKQKEEYSVFADKEKLLSAKENQTQNVLVSKPGLIQNILPSDTLRPGLCEKLKIILRGKAEQWNMQRICAKFLTSIWIEKKNNDVDVMGWKGDMDSNWTIFSWEMEKNLPFHTNV